MVLASFRLSTGSLSFGGHFLHGSYLEAAPFGEISHPCSAIAEHSSSTLAL